MSILCILGVMMLNLLLVTNPNPTVIEKEIEIVMRDDIKVFLENTLPSLKEEGTMLSTVHLQAVVVMIAGTIEGGVRM